MDFFIKKIFENKIDELVHQQFQKFSRGEFCDRAKIHAKISNKLFKINCDPEYANELVRYLAIKLKDKKTLVKGVIISTKDLTGKLLFKDKKQFMGIKKYVIEKEMSGDEILNLCDAFPNAFIGFSFKTANSELKIKPKAPKSAKPKSKDSKNKPINFCKLKTTDKELFSKLIFEKGLDFSKEIEINHDFVIKEIIFPKDEKDFAKIRELAKRKGEIIRKIEIDGKTLEKIHPFEA